MLQDRIDRAQADAPWRDDLSYATTRPRECAFATDLELSWLAGWLEGEGSFLAPPPSDPRRPRISAVSRDLDVIARVARVFGVTPAGANDRRARERGWSPLFGVLYRGSRAAALMSAIVPMMGSRRRAQIERALHRGVMTGL